MIPKQLRFRDLKALGIVNNWVTLGEWIDNLQFPAGRMVGKNTRLWTEPEVEAWLSSRPSDPKPTPPKKKLSDCADAAEIA